MTETNACTRCGKPESICVCDRAPTLKSPVDVLILQHPQEQDVDLGTVPLLLASLPRAEKVVGLSWASFSQALGRDADPAEWLVLYPSSLKRELSAAEKATPVVLLDRKGATMEPKRVKGIVALDGTWSQAKALWWRNAWMLKLGRALVHPKEPSIYGRMRKEPRKEYVSTLEAVAMVVDALGGDLGPELRRLFRTMVQKARDSAPKTGR
ncbi:MAG: DTW domain-containing protein [Deltaproteobacteria bacterium]|nr:DTW domain-containing protein [Deltaproteobacteria bacterium]